MCKKYSFFLFSVFLTFFLVISVHNYKRIEMIKGQKDKTMKFIHSQCATNIEVSQAF